MPNLPRETTEPIIRTTVLDDGTLSSDHVPARRDDGDTGTPGLFTRMASAAAAAVRFAAGGFASVAPDVYVARRAVCNACPHWRNNHCQRCGCHAIKLHWPAERCPIGKW